MGLLRLLFAFAVVSNHYSNHQVFDLLYASVAVKGFYIISGFYMALILNNDSYVKNRQFYLSRFFRLYPIYISCVIITMIFGFGNTTSGTNIFSDNLGIIPSTFIIFTNLTMIFQDLTMITGVNGNNIEFVQYFTDSKPLPIYNYLYVPQAWSLGLELSFYLVAPFLLKNIKIEKILFFIVLSLMIRGLLMAKGFKEDPWNYRFFPSEISLFLAGSISYIFYKKKLFFKDQDIQKILTFFIICFVASFSYLRIPEKDIIFYICLIILLPTIFICTKNLKIDKFFGDISYPVYCCHILVFHFFINKVDFLSSNPTGFIQTVISYSIVSIVAIILYYFIQVPSDKIRIKLKNNK
tara:strand:+ start:322 stop:1377 length:1056 start_codon:yes stop_codon:yes gene_type:complete